MLNANTSLDLQGKKTTFFSFGKMMPKTLLICFIVSLIERPQFCTKERTSYPGNSVHRLHINSDETQLLSLSFTFLGLAASSPGSETIIRQSDFSKKKKKRKEKAGADSSLYRTMPPTELGLESF